MHGLQAWPKLRSSYTHHLHFADQKHKSGFQRVERASLHLFAGVSNRRVSPKRMVSVRLPFKTIQKWYRETTETNRGANPSIGFQSWTQSCKPSSLKSFRSSWCTKCARALVQNMTQHQAWLGSQSREVRVAFGKPAQRDAGLK